MFSTENLQYIWNGARQDQLYYWCPIGSRIRAFDWCQKRRRWMTLRGHYELFSKHVRFSEPNTQIWMNIDSYYRRQWCSPMFPDSGNIRFMRIFAGFPGDGASSDSGVIVNIDFQGFWTLLLLWMSFTGCEFECVQQMRQNKYFLIYLIVMCILCSLFFFCMLRLYFSVFCCVNWNRWSLVSFDGRTPFSGSLPWLFVCVYLLLFVFVFI